MDSVLAIVTIYGFGAAIGSALFLKSRNRVATGRFKVSDPLKYSTYAGLFFYLLVVLNGFYFVYPSVPFEGIMRLLIAVLSLAAAIYMVKTDTPPAAIIVSAFFLIFGIETAYILMNLPLADQGPIVPIILWLIAVGSHVALSYFLYRAWRHAPSASEVYRIIEIAAGAAALATFWTLS